MVDDGAPSRWQQTRLDEPIFHYPAQEPRKPTAVDLITIIKFCKINGITPTRKDRVVLYALRGTKDRSRKIVRIWPRDPEGKFYPPDDSCPGKTAPIGIPLWGATMFDFYIVNRAPDVFGMLGTTTGSRMTEWVKQNDELNHAKYEIEWAEWEPDPVQYRSWPVAEAIEEMEDKIKLGKAGVSLPTKGKAPSTGSIFDLSAYPHPWPLVPFSHPTQRLSSLIDHANLPQKLVVHDPWNLLTGYAYEEEDDDEKMDVDELPASKSDNPWTSKPDRIVIYKLNREQNNSSTPEVTTTNDDDDDDDDESRISPSDIKSQAKIFWQNSFHLHRPEYFTGRRPPPVLISHSPPPRKNKLLKPKLIEEAHLYLSPLHSAGAGNHSIVYRAELELPRSAVMTDVTDYILCKKCAREDALRQLRFQDGENGERMDPRWKENSSWIEQHPIGRPHLKEDTTASTTSDMPENIAAYVIDHSKSEILNYQGPQRVIQTNVEWQDGRNPTCRHLTSVPPTVRVSVIAKLSIENDEHLVREAMNYQRFSKHVFEHWSGLGVVSPIRDPVPLAPVVPQFYGYYVPVTEPAPGRDGTDEEESEEKPYISPILLLEDCGEQIDNVSNLTTDQRQEAISLLFRLHQTNWCHGSVFPRNFLIQPGPLTLPPELRSINTPSFRLVDFGRSTECPENEKGVEFRDWDKERSSEAGLMKRMFKLPPDLY